MTGLKRMWINQPSTLQPHHDKHGTLVLAQLNKWARSWTIYFTSGPIVSQVIQYECLSEGWPVHLQPRGDALVQATTELNTLGKLAEELAKDAYVTCDGPTNEMVDKIVAEIDRRIKAIKVPK